MLNSTSINSIHYPEVHCCAYWLCIYEQSGYKTYISVTQFTWIQSIMYNWNTWTIVCMQTQVFFVVVEKVEYSICIKIFLCQRKIKIQLEIKQQVANKKTIFYIHVACLPVEWCNRIFARCTHNNNKFIMSKKGA